MLARELRQKYFDFFVGRGHLVQPSASLVPENDPSQIFTGAGMIPFKPYFYGAALPPHTRLTTCQKCVRTTDIEDVGDFSHCTFFEMLGNFSFGDYFQAEVIPWAWEFLTQWLKLDPDRLCVTIYLTDDEAFRIWNEVIGLPPDRIHRLDEDKNYWPPNSASDPEFTGPCGPNSEIFYRVAPEEEMTQDPNLTPTERYKLDDKAGRWLELWNLVFIQYNRGKDAEGKPLLSPLPKKNIDTGMGLDRVAYVLQGGKSIYDNDQLRSIVARLEELSGKTYGGTNDPQDIAFRLVTEHVRSLTFIITDGVEPGNTDRNYVLRRIMRRAILRGKTQLGFEEPFLDQVVPAVVAAMGDAYPELRERERFICGVARHEEELFRETLERGIERFNHAANAQDGKTFSGEIAFDLYSTYGFPLDLTQEMATERGLIVDMEGFRQAEEAHRHRSSGKTGPVFVDKGTGLAEVQRHFPPTEFLGYTHADADARVLALLQNGATVEFARAGDEVTVVLDRTPFYAESGGPVGDTGRLEGQPRDVTCRFVVEVTDTQKDNGYWLHRGKVLEGEITPDAPVRARVDIARRRAILRNHTTTHLLQAALRQVLGPDVHQAGSKVEPDQLRFDFTYPHPLTHEQLEQIEEIVNTHILDDTEVLIHNDVPIEEARQRGAMALFGEKYGSTVRMVEIPGFSLELCGGIHLTHTSQAGLFKIVSETGVSAGVRRIVAVTGAGAVAYVARREEALAQVAALLKSNPNDVVTAAERLVAQRQELERKNRQLIAETVSAKVSIRPSASVIQNRNVNGVSVIAEKLDGMDAEMLANTADQMAQQQKSAVIVLGTVTDGRVAFTAKVTGDLVAKGLHAGNLVREVAKIAGGGGGGRPEFATAGGRDPSKLQEALDAVPRLVEAALGDGPRR
jgi:alanyl-tRNA synthetase